MVSKQEVIISLTHYEALADLPEQDQDYIRRTYAYAHTAAYAPFSNYRVGALIITEEGHEVFGANQENASYPAGLCAERVAFSSLSSQYPDAKPVKLILTVNEPHYISDLPAAPCGICRQTIKEYEGRFTTDIEILFPSQNRGFYRVKSIKSLLPLGFNAKNLDK